MILRFLVIVSAVAGMIWSGCGDGGGSPAGEEVGDVEFSGLRAEDIGASRAVIRFATSLPTSCEAEYGLAEATLDQVATDPSMMGLDTLAYDHEVPLEDLESGTVYYYRARATDGSGRTFRSGVLQFSTEPAPATELVNFAPRDQGTAVTGVSSNFGGAGNDDVWGAHQAIDGQMASEWATNGDGDDAWIGFDFGRQRSISRFEFRSRRMADGSSIITSLRLSFDETTLLSPFQTPDPDVLYGFDIVPPVRARTVRLDAVTTTGGNTGAREIRFLGPPE